MFRKIIQLSISTLIITGLILSCATAAQRLEPPQYTIDVRLADIERLADSDPTAAIQAIEVFKARYPNVDVTQQEALETQFQRAVTKLLDDTKKAVTAKEWNRARSL
ncbi:MAG TPA: hypothetical protein P5336_03005, partial [Treponema sp.]|nr:hypothetical protein [Treponema sp.]